MKRIVSFMGLCALVLLSCQKNQPTGAPADAGAAVSYKLVGTNNPGSSRVSVGQLTEDGWPILWLQGDAVGVFKTGVAERFGKASLDADSAGSNYGSFTMVSDEEYSGEVVIAHPESASYSSDGVLTGNVPALQVRNCVGNSAHIGKSSLAYGKAVMNGADVPVDFELTHVCAYVRLKIGSTEFKSHVLEKVTLFCDGQALSGNISVNVHTGDVTVSETGDYVTVSFRDGTSVLGEDGAVVWFSTLPVDLTGRKVYVIVHMTKGIETVQVPICINGAALKPHMVNGITIPDFRSSMAPSWYEISETRNLLDGYAYGDANTHFVEQNPDEDKSSVISVKARGDFMKVSEPAYYGLYSGSSDMSGRKVFYLPNDVKAYEEVPTNAVSDDCCMTIYSYKGPQDNNNHGRWATVAVYDADYNLLWSFMIMKYLTGDEPKSISYSSVGYDMLDRNLGAIYSSDYAVTKGKTDNPWAYFQWGRKDPFMWSNSGLEGRYNIASADGVDIAASIVNPGLQYGYLDDNNGDWKSVASDDDADLWGGVSDTKTIYDPCPKGYRVPDFEVLSAVSADSQRCEYELGLESQESANVNASPYSDSSVLKYETSSGVYDYWPYGGAIWGSSNAEHRNRTESNGIRGALYWANSLGDDAVRAQALSLCYYSEGNFKENVSEFRANAFLIRCMKDTENR